MMAGAAALLMAFTRVYVGAHYPGDVIAGLVLGAAVTVVGHAAARPAVLALVRRLARTPLSPLVGTRGRLPAAGTVTRP
jgi:membrane-associated phospholipid phosphatase